MVASGRARPGAQESVDLIYSRISHPNAEILEDQIVPLEPGAQAAAVFNSGMAAISTLFFAYCRSGDSFVYTAPLYGGTEGLIKSLLARLGIQGISVAAGDTKGLDRAIRDARDLRLVFVETPANPTLRMTDIAAAARIAHRERGGRRALLAVDNTFLGPVFQSPLLHGADLVLYSATKYIGGHSDVVAGAAVARDPELLQRVKATRAFFGTICEPFSAWLLQRSLATIYTRTIKQSKNAARIVERLKDHPKIRRIFYPTLFDGEQGRVYSAQCTAPGGMIALDLEGGEEAAFRFLDALEIAKLAVSLGGVETLATHPKTTVSSEMPPEELERAGITDGLVRYSTGVEYWRDLLADIQQALDTV